MKIAVIGGGLTGLVLAYRLSGLGHEISIFEKEGQLGGLSTFYNFGKFYWDKFYHVILPSDSSLIGLINELDLSSDLKWKNTRTGYYVDHTFYSISTTKEFLSFPPLNILNKIRLGLTIFYGTLIHDWKSLEHITAEQWLRKWNGDKTYKKFWQPLLNAKFGKHHSRVSAVFIWTYIQRLFSARDRSAKQKEQLGYIAGGYKTFIKKIEQKLSEANVEIELSARVTKIRASKSNTIRVEVGKHFTEYDKVVFTGPANLLNDITEAGLCDSSQKETVVEYMGVITLALVTSQELVPYYTVNIADADLPFTGIIGMSSVVELQETDESYLTYFPKYVLWSDPLLNKPDEDIIKLFMESVYKLFPFLNKEDVLSIHINRAKYVQPLQVIDYSNIVPEINTTNENFYILNSSQLINNTLNNNAVIATVDSFVRAYKEDFE